MQLIIPVHNILLVQELLLQSFEPKRTKRERLAMRNRAIGVLKSLKLMEASDKVSEIGICLGGDSVTSVIVNVER